MFNKEYVIFLQALSCIEKSIALDKQYFLKFETLLCFEILPFVLEYKAIWIALFKTMKDYFFVYFQLTQKT